jgi:uncharacterized protein (TIGR00299 family) protein
VHIDHGICTVPTPGTAELLKGVPLVDVPVEAELTTPTGAAILKTMVDRFVPLPAMTIERIGYGAGTRDLPGRANVLRMFVGAAAESTESDHVVVLETNLDDVSGEIVGYTKERLLVAGALDVYTVAIHMKKNRPGVVLSVICRPADVEPLEAILFAETGTLGIRRHRAERTKQARREHVVDTAWGPVRGKLGWRGAGRPAFSPEFDECARIAAGNGVPLREVYRAAEAAFDPKSVATSASHPAASPPKPHSHDHDHGHVHDHGHHHDHDHGHDHDHDDGR